MTLSTTSVDFSSSIFGRLVQSGHRDIHINEAPQPGDYAWIYDPTNEGEFHQYPDIDRETH